MTHRIEFIAFHQPALKAGDYRLVAEQRLSSTSGRVPANTLFRSPMQRFSVAGARFELTPDDIVAVFPPAGSLGEHSNVLPHVVLRRSTLPWERVASDDDPSKPWLVLLLFQEGEKLGGQIAREVVVGAFEDGEALWSHLLDSAWLELLDTDRAFILAEASRASATLGGDFAGREGAVEALLDAARTPQIFSLEDLAMASSGRVHWPGVEPQAGQEPGDPVTVIDVPVALLHRIMPGETDLAYQAHVRLPIPDDGEAVEENERAVVLGSRLPTPNSLSTVYLVSVEGRYDGSGFGLPDDPANSHDFVRLVSLKSWRFACVSPRESFSQLLVHADRDPDTLRLPEVGEATADAYLASGYVPLPHSLRRGSETVSWYHGPLLPGASSTEIAVPVRSSDELLRYDPSNGLFDTSYAAAWELGRLLALQSQAFSVALFQWKRAHKQSLDAAEQSLLHGHLPVGPKPRPVELPDAVRSWFERLSLLEGVPFAYLVPEERLLPAESIRFFRVDPAWVDCLLDGAFSLGRVRPGDLAHDRDHLAHAAQSPHSGTSGFLLRSAVVAGWPELQVDGYRVAPTSDAQADFDLPVDDQVLRLRMERLSANTLLCLFQEEVHTVDIHLKPEALHFGVNRPDDDHPSYFKNLRNAAGQETPIEIDVPIDPDTRVIRIAELAQDIREAIDAGALGDADIAPKSTFVEFTAAQFAMEMIEGVEKVRFIRR